MRAVFISYRRDDVEGHAGRLFQDLVSQFGKDAIFMDVAGIEPGRDFRKVIDQNVASCGVLLAIIGKGWLGAKNEAGRRRVDDPNDFVRLETAAALKRDILVIPVLVQGGKLPRAEELPEDLKDLAYRNAVELTHARWDSDVQLLVKALRPYVGQQDGKGSTTSATPPTERTQGTLGAGNAASTSDAPDAGGIAPAAVSESTKKSWHKLLLVSVTAIAVAVGGYLTYDKFTAEKAAAEKAQKEVAIANAETAAAKAAAATAQEQATAAKAAAEKVAQEQATAARVAAARRTTEDEQVPTKKPNRSADLPNFAGTWVEINPRNPANPATLVITRNGEQFQIGPKLLSVTNDGRLTYKTFAAHDDKYGHSVETEAEADLVDTLTWSLEGPILVFDTIFDYRRPYFGHPLGKEPRVIRYKRTGPTPSRQ